MKAQAAMEFLATYGWAILLVLVLVGALSYFGVLNPDRFLPQRCTGPAGLDCVDTASASAVTGYVVMALRNNNGFPIDIVDSVTASGNCASPSIVDINGISNPNLWQIGNNENLKVTIDCGNAITTGRNKMDITITYTNTETGLTRSSIVTANVIAS